MTRKMETDRMNDILINDETKHDVKLVNTEIHMLIRSYLDYGFNNHAVGHVTLLLVRFVHTIQKLKEFILDSIPVMSTDYVF